MGNIETWLTSGGMMLVLITLVQFIKTKFITKKIPKEYTKLTTIIAAILVGLSLGFVSYYFNTIFNWMPDYTIADMLYVVLTAVGSAVLSNQLYKARTESINNG